MNRFISRLVLVAITMASASVAMTQNVTVQMAGTPSATNFVGVNGIRDAVLAVGNGGSVNVLTAGDYSSVSLIGGKVYQVKGMVPGVNIVSSGASSAAATSPTTGSPVDIRLVNLNIIATSGSSAVAFQINQHVSATNKVYLESVAVRQQTVNNALGRDALKIQGTSVADSGLVNLWAISSTFDCATTDTATNNQNEVNQRDALNLAGAANSLRGLEVRLTSCTLKAESGQAIDWGTTQQDNMTWTIRNCSLSTDNNASRQTLFAVDMPHNNCNITIEDSFLRGPARIVDNENRNGTNNIWRVNRSTLDNRKFGVNTGTNQTVWRLRYNTNTATPFNQLTYTNMVLIQHAGSGMLEHAANSTSTLIHCLLLRDVASNNSGITFNNGGAGANFKMYNSIIAGGNSAAGSIAGPIPAANVARNIIAATPAQDDADLGVDRISTTMAALNLGNFLTDPSPITPFIPGSGSVAINAGLTTPSLNAAVGNVDRRKFSRTNTVPDIGPIETGFVPVELSTFAID